MDAEGVESIRGKDLMRWMIEMETRKANQMVWGIDRNEDEEFLLVSCN